MSTIQLVSLLLFLAWIYYYYLRRRYILTDEESVYLVTHKGWFLFCPVWLADYNTDILTPIERYPWLEGWMDFMLDIQQCINWLISWFSAEGGGFLFWYVTPLKEPFEKKIKVGKPV